MLASCRLRYSGIVRTPVPTGTSSSFPAKSSGTDDSASFTHFAASSLFSPHTTESTSFHIGKIKQMGIQLIWQTGESYYKQNEMALSMIQTDEIKIMPFIRNMNDAYGVADFIISRAGALAIAELGIVAAPTILVPFPYAAEDHQTKNALALVDKGAAILVKDSEVSFALIPAFTELFNDSRKCEEMAEAMKQFAQPDAVAKIVENIMSL